MHASWETTQVLRSCPKPALPAIPCLRSPACARHLQYGDVICTTVPEIVVVMLYDFFSVFWWA